MMGETLLPAGTLREFPLDTFVFRLLSQTVPPVMREHCTLHAWWIQQAKPMFEEQRRVAREKEKEDKGLEDIAAASLNVAL